MARGWCGNTPRALGPIYQGSSLTSPRRQVSAHGPGAAAMFTVIIYGDQRFRRVSAVHPMVERR